MISGIKALIEEDKPVEFIQNLKDRLNAHRDATLTESVIRAGTFWNPGRTPGENRMLDDHLSGVKTYSDAGVPRPNFDPNKNSVDQIVTRVRNAIMGNAQVDPERNADSWGNSKNNIDSK